MGIKMDLGAAENQASTVQAAMNERLAAYDQVLAAIDQLIGASDLQGQAFGNTKAYADSKLRPLIQGAKLLCQEVGPATGKSPKDYRGQVGGCYYK